MLLKNIQKISVKLPFRGRASLGGMEHDIVGRKQIDCPDQNAGNRAAQIQKASAHELFQSRAHFLDPVNKEIKDQKDEDHDGYVIVAKYGSAEGNDIETAVSVINQTLRPHHDQREEENTVQPHMAPHIGRRKAAQCVKLGEKHGRDRPFPAPVFEIISHGKAGQGYFENDQDLKHFQHHAGRKQENDQIDRGGQIVSHHRPEIKAQAAMPGIEKTFPAADLVVQLGNKRHILVIRIDDRRRMVAKRPHAHGRIGRDHNQNGQYKSCGRIEIFLPGQPRYTSLIPLQSIHKAILSPLFT